MKILSIESTFVIKSSLIQAFLIGVCLQCNCYYSYILGSSDSQIFQNSNANVIHEQCKVFETGKITELFGNASGEPISQQGYPPHILQLI
jgi:hypothetical protein